MFAASPARRGMQALAPGVIPKTSEHSKRIGRVP
jgi:hypothetical protein